MPLDRPLEIAAFLDQHGWGEAQAQALDGDFSPRRYARLSRMDGLTAFLMDADPDQKTPHFVAVAKILRQMGIHAPEIYAADAAHGLVLMQDLGSRNVGALLDAGESPCPIFMRATEILAQVHQRFDSTITRHSRENGNPAASDSEHIKPAAFPLEQQQDFCRADARRWIPAFAGMTGLDMPIYDTAHFTAQAELFLDSYFPFATGHEASDEEREDFHAAWQAVLRPLESLPQSLMLRDFMPDNLMDWPNGKLGVLDFQDAGIGPVAYDLASLCEEVRRGGGFALLPDVVAHYREKAQSPLSQADLLRACTILSAQRHTRILGIIAQLAVKKGRRDKLDFVPRILRHLTHILDKSYLLPVGIWMKRNKVITQA
jgi:aminoglycoside/choline kinase family phosphotransferase